MDEAGRKRNERVRVRGVSTDTHSYKHLSYVSSSNRKLHQLGLQESEDSESASDEEEEATKHNLSLQQIDQPHQPDLLNIKRLLQRQTMGSKFKSQQNSLETTPRQRNPMLEHRNEFQKLASKGLQQKAGNDL